MDQMDDKLERVIAYLLGELDSAAAREVEALLSHDSELREVFSAVSELQKEGKEIDWSEIRQPINDMTSRLIEDFRRRKGAGGSDNGVLVYDSRYLPLPEGVRPATTGTRKLHYKFDNGELDISLYPISPESYEIVGQASGDQFGKEIRLRLKSGSTSFKTESDNFRLFRFERVPAKQYKLSIVSDGKATATVIIDI